MLLADGMRGTCLLFMNWYKTEMNYLNPFSLKIMKLVKELNTNLQKALFSQRIRRWECSVESGFLRLGSLTD